MASNMAVKRLYCLKTSKHKMCGKVFIENDKKPIYYKTILDIVQL